jgi:hypothetical protein
MFKYIRRLLGKAYEGVKSFGKHIYKKLPSFSDLQKIDDFSRKNFSPGVRAILLQCGNDIVTNIRVCRDPVSESTEGLLNTVSLGVWNQLKKKYGYDRFFHLYMLFDAGGKTLMIEKNQTINLSYYYKACKDSMEVSPGGTFTLNQMLEKTKARMGEYDFFMYDPLTTNCQNFIMNILEANSISSPSIKEFVYQDLKDMLKELPSYVGPVARGLTNVARVIDTALQNSVYDTNGNEGTENPPNAS